MGLTEGLVTRRLGPTQGQEMHEIDLQRPLKIILLSSSYPRSQDDSAGVFLSYLAQNLGRRGLSVRVLAPSDGATTTTAEGAVTVHRFQYFPKRLQRLAYGSGMLGNLKKNPWLWLEVPFFVAAMLYSLLRLTHREKPDLIHAHWLLPAGLVAVYTKQWHHAGVLTTVHGSDAFHLKNRFFDMLKRKVLQRSEAWTANSHATGEALGTDGALMKPHIIPMGVDVERFQNGERSRLRSGLSENDFVLLFVGRLVEGKGVDHLLKALTLLPARLRATTRLWLVGEGHDTARLKQYTQELAIDLKVQFWGPIRNELLPDFYAAADLLVAPTSDTEGQGVVLAEAFAALLCVLATRVGGIREIVEDGATGMLVEPRDARALARAIETLLDNPGLRQKLAHNGFLRARNDYDWKKIATDFEDLYRELIEKNQH